MSDLYRPSHERIESSQNPEGVPQADPALGLSHHTRASGWQIGLTLAAAFLIVAVVIYGLNHQAPERHEASAPAASQQTTGAAPSGGAQVPAGTAAQAPAKMPGESGDPKTTDTTGSPQQQTPEQGKPTTDSSQR